MASEASADSRQTMKLEGPQQCQDEGEAHPASGESAPVVQSKKPNLDGDGGTLRHNAGTGPLGAAYVPYAAPGSGAATGQVRMRRGKAKAEGEADMDQDVHSDGSGGPSRNDDTDKQSSSLLMVQTKVYTTLHERQSCIKRGVLVLLFLLYAAYFSYANYKMADNIHRNLGLIILTAIALGIGLLYASYKLFGPRIAQFWRQRLRIPVTHYWRKYFRWVFLALIVVGLIVFIALDARKTPMRLVSGLGVFLFIALGFILSKKPSKIPWHTVGCGVLLQLLLGLLILRWPVGFSALRWLSNQLVIFLGYTDTGSKLVFGAEFSEHEFAFQVAPVIIFFGSVTSVLYYFGILQVMIWAFGGFMEFVMGIGAAEAFVAAANVFLGPNVSALTIKSFLPDMTMSELHTVMTSGFATVMASLFGLYKSFNINMTHLITASVMSAPGALAMGKMMYPELERSKLKKDGKITFTPAAENNAIEAAVNGAIDAGKIVAHLLANLVAFVAMLAFINATLTWFGHRVGIYDPDLTFQLICGYLLYPLALMMGVEPKDCFDVAHLIGTKLMLTEIIGYEKMEELIQNRALGVDPQISARSEMIATYAICGFGTFVDIGIGLGALGAIVPSRKADLCQVALRAMVAGNIACFITASIAGFLMDDAQL